MCTAGGASAEWKQRGPRARARALSLRTPVSRCVAPRRVLRDTVYSIGSAWFVIKRLALMASEKGV